MSKRFARPGAQEKEHADPPHDAVFHPALQPARDDALAHFVRSLASMAGLAMTADVATSAVGEQMALDAILGWKNRAEAAEATLEKAKKMREQVARLASLRLAGRQVDARKAITALILEHIASGGEIEVLPEDDLDEPYDGDQ